MSVKSALPFYVRVAVPSPLYGHFDYLPPAAIDANALVPGVRVCVPFGKRNVIGVLLEIANYTHIPGTKLKCVHQVLDEKPLIPTDMLALARWAAGLTITIPLAK